MFVFRNNGLAGLQDRRRERTPDRVTRMSAIDRAGCCGKTVASRATRAISHGMLFVMRCDVLLFLHIADQGEDYSSSFDDLDGDRDALPRSPLCFTMAASFRLQTRRERVSFWIITCTISEPAFCYHDRHCLSLSCLQANLTSSAMCSP